jgi:hypothetical protein
MWKWTARILVSIAILILLLRVADRMARRAGPLPEVPQPNAYEELLRVAAEVRIPLREIAELSEDEIRRLAAANEASLERLRVALRGAMKVPLQTTNGWVEQHGRDVDALKKLALVIGVRGRAHMLDGNTNQTAACFLDVLLLGQALPKGGLVSDGVNGLTIETVGMASLRALIPSLSAEFCRQAAQELEQMEAKRESPERILATERDWSARSFGLVNRIGGVLRRSADADRDAKFLSRYEEATGRTRRLMMSLAARAIELETGVQVSNPGTLVPHVLKAVPLDPKSGSPYTDMPVLAN